MVDFVLVAEKERGRLMQLLEDREEEHAIVVETTHLVEVGLLLFILVKL